MLLVAVVYCVMFVVIVVGAVLLWLKFVDASLRGMAVFVCFCSGCLLCVVCLLLVDVGLCCLFGFGLPCCWCL